MRNKIGKDTSNYQASVEEEDSMPMPKLGKDMVDVVFTQNRSYELIIGRERIIFQPNERKLLSRKVIEHPDFQSQAQFFVIIN